MGYNGLGPKEPERKNFWNRIPDEEREKVVTVALEIPELSPRELAWHITDYEGWYISESSVYRILKSRGLITSPTHIVQKAADEFKDKTTRINKLWQTDFTYLKVIGWGWYYLSTILDDYSRYIISWKLCKNMKSDDVERSIQKALQITGLKKNQHPRLLSDNGSCLYSVYIIHSAKPDKYYIGFSSDVDKCLNKKYIKRDKNKTILHSQMLPEQLLHKPSRIIFAGSA